ncbi:hypothetical protein NX722_26715 [Endozoicomonas gorgoniicola]|uniref:Uncharacterized protein n=1 Tax=Endozoicomonas gorgoniicola TaxID=1234144 RepID=A0ABT3N3F3_9GAMM|nr:hypothetical protein [Endozoicomonas gorgoniicola]MCW7556156.1 hypothetical protein [Endozoicomonas gorgoniicola]
MAGIEQAAKGCYSKTGRPKQYAQTATHVKTCGIEVCAAKSLPVYIPAFISETPFIYTGFGQITFEFSR